MPPTMESPLDSNSDSFVDRRGGAAETDFSGADRRQFSNGYDDLTPEARDLAQAVDQYKLHHRRRFVSYEELLGVVKSLGYRK